MTDFDNAEELQGRESGPDEWVHWIIGLYREYQDFLSLDAKASKSSERFTQQCSQAAAAALILRKYSACTETIGFIPVSFSKYLARLEEFTGVLVEPALQHFGITNREQLSPASVSGFAKIWRALGLSLEAALTTLRITLYLPEQGAWGGIRFRSSGAPLNLLEASKSQIREIEFQLSSAQILEGHKLESDIRTVYQASSQE